MTELLIKDKALQEIAKRIQWGLASDDDLERAGVDNVCAIKADPDRIQYKFKAGTPEKTGARKKRFIANEESQDRAGDVIEQRGWDHAAFMENPVALWGHNPDVPIGNVAEIVLDETGKTLRLLESIEYAKEGVSDQADKAFRLVDAGVVRAVSVGFRPLKTAVPKNDAERKEMGVGRFGVRYQKQEQLELSQCTIPMHPAALEDKGLNVKACISKALDEMVERKELTRSAAEELWTAADSLEDKEPQVFALGGIPDLPEGTDNLSTEDANVTSEFEIVAIEALAEVARSQNETIGFLREQIKGQLRGQAESIRALEKRVAQMHQSMQTKAVVVEDDEAENDFGDLFKALEGGVRLNLNRSNNDG